jgi:hypothetical protein
VIHFGLVEPGSLVGTNGSSATCIDRLSLLLLLTNESSLRCAGRGEWVVGACAGGPSLHVYRLGRADWLVSEVGCDTEGRGLDLERALAALSARVGAPDWWNAVAESFIGGDLENGKWRRAEP